MARFGLGSSKVVVSLSERYFAVIGREICRKDFLLIRHTIIWSARNDLVVYNNIPVIEQLVDKIQFTSWYWFFERRFGHPCLRYEWMVEPLLCWDR